MAAPNPVAFVLFGRNVYWYGILIAIAVLLGIILAYREAKRKSFDPDSMLDFALLCIPLSIICARAYYVAFEWQRYADNPISALYIWEGGIAIYGGVIGGIIAALIFCRWKKIGFWKLTDMVVPSLVLGQAIGRWGNFFNQEAYGYAVTDPGQQWFPFSVFIQADQTWHYATFFYESLACFIIFAVLMLYRKKAKQDGNVFLLYFVLYGIERAFVEGLRTDSLYFHLGSLDIRVSQLLSIVMALVCLIALLMRMRKRHLEAGELDPSLVMRRPETDADEDEAEDAAEAAQTAEAAENAEAPKDENTVDADVQTEADKADAPKNEAQGDADEAAEEESDKDNA